MTEVVFRENLRIVMDKHPKQNYEPVNLYNILYYYNPSNIYHNFAIYFVDISKYKKYNEVFVNILYPKFTKTFIGLLPVFNLTEEKLFYLKLNEVDYEIIH